MHQSRSCLRWFALLASLASVTCSGSRSDAPGADAGAAAAPAPLAFEGARLITGGEPAVIEDATVTIEGSRITQAGPRGTVVVPAGARRIDVRGKTIMPATIDAHAHIGYMRDLTSGPQNYTEENILDHLRRYAYFGVAAGMAMGSDFGDLPYRMRDQSRAGAYPDAARFLTAGRGLAPPDEVRPDNMRHSAYRITTTDEARAAVRELAALGVTVVKTWVDDRGGAVRKLTPELYGAIIDEAHANRMRVMVHATALSDAKALLRAGVDGFGHAFQEVDDELIALVRERPTTFFLLALGGPRRVVYAPWIDPPHPLVAETVTPAQIARLRQRLARESVERREPAARAWAKMADGIARLAGAGGRIGLGTDGGGQLGDQFVGWTVHTEMENMVAAGMSPQQVILAATRVNAGIVGLDELGAVAPGKSADFVVLDANPLDDITNTRRIAAVYLRGREVDRPALRTAWTQSAATSQ